MSYFTGFFFNPKPSKGCIFYSKSTSYLEAKLSLKAPALYLEFIKFTGKKGRFTY